MGNKFLVFSYFPRCQHEMNNSPALLMIGVNTTETQAALNDSVQLLSMGIVPDSVGPSPRLLTSFKDFDDDDKRLDAAYRRQVSR